MLRFARAIADWLGWIAAVGMAAGAYWYIEDVTRKMDDILLEIRHVAELETQKDDLWLGAENDRFDSVDRDLTSVIGLIAAQNYNLGVHQGEHNRVR